MAARENLIPTRTVDKNGRTTTVYRTGRTVIGAKAVPAPAVGESPEDDSESVRRVVDMLFQNDTYVRQHDRKIILDKLMDAPADLLDRIHSVVMDGELDDDPEGTRLKIRTRILKDDFTFAVLNEALCFYPVLTGRTFFVAEQMIKSLHLYSQLPRCSDFSKEGPEVVEQCTSLLKCMEAALGLKPTEAFYDETDRSFVFKDDSLMELILEHAQHAEVIAGVIRDRRSLNPELIRHVIGDESSALAGGAL